MSQKVETDVAQVHLDEMTDTSATTCSLKWFRVRLLAAHGRLEVTYGKK